MAKAQTVPRAMRNDMWTSLTFTGPEYQLNHVPCAIDFNPVLFTPRLCIAGQTARFRPQVISHP